MKLLSVAAASVLASAGWAQEPVFERQEKLAAEDLRSAAFWIRARDPASESFEATDKAPVEAAYSALLVVSWPDFRKHPRVGWGQTGPQGSFGVFLVYGRTNQVYMVLDHIDRRELPDAIPAIETAARDSLIVDFYGNYGAYRGSRKYVYDLARRRILARIPYYRVDYRARTEVGGGICYAGVGLGQWQPKVLGDWRNFILCLEPRHEEALPACQWVEWKDRSPEAQRTQLERRGETLVLRRDGEELAWRVSDLAPARVPPPDPEPPPDYPRVARPGVTERTYPPKSHVYRRPGGWLVVWNAEIVDFFSGPSGVSLVGDGGQQDFFPLPQPDLEQWMRLRGSEPRGEWKPAQENIRNDIGPFALEGDKLWFATTFYDGEGMTGLGAIGSFDCERREYELRYVPELARWSSSAFRLEEDAIWLGLVKRPEGALQGGGLLQFNRRDGAVRRWALEALVHSIDRRGEVLYLGSSHGIYLVRPDSVVRLRLEPVASQRWQIVTQRLAPDP